VHWLATDGLAGIQLQNDRLFSMKGNDECTHPLASLEQDATGESSQQGVGAWWL